MALLISAHNLGKSYASQHLFSDISFGIEEGVHLSLIGPNGAGKSTLLKIIAGLERADEGRVTRKAGLRVAYLEQSPEFAKEATLFSAALEKASDPDDWETQSKAHEWISKFEFLENGIDAETPISSLSGGWRKRVAIVRELMTDPDLFLLDEPTNHLDVESILWLEGFLSRAPFSTLVITHDRQFMQRISQEILELDRRNPSGLLRVKGTYSDYLKIKQETMQAQESQEQKLKNTLRRETEWLLKGPKARTTKQTARIDRAYELQDVVGEVEARNQTRTADISFMNVTGGPKKLIEAKKISKSYGDRKLFEELDFLVRMRARIGLLGRNGAGKSTLVKVLLGETTPDSGTVMLSENLKVAYFEQNRDELDPHLTVLKSVCPEGEYVKLGEKFVHVNGYLERFLFSRERSQTKISKLSGGEQSRVLLAKLMLREANLIVLDEPTNDLDLATLHVLEESLAEFPGALILITHDRLFMDQLCDEIYSLDHGKVERFADVNQWEVHFQEAQRQAALPAHKKATVSTGGQATVKLKKLSFNLQRELDGMEQAIQDAERNVTQLTLESTQPEVLKDSKALLNLSRELGAAQSNVEKLYRRWEELLKMQSE